MMKLPLKERMLAKQRTADGSSKHSSPRDLYQQEEVDEDHVDPGGSPAAGGVYDQDDDLVFLGESESKKGRRGRIAGNGQHKQHSSPHGSAAKMESSSVLVPDVNPDDLVNEEFGGTGGSPRTPEPEDDEPNVGVFSPSRGSFVFARGIVGCREEVVVSSRYCWVGISR